MSLSQIEGAKPKSLQLSMFFFYTIVFCTKVLFVVVVTVLDTLADAGNWGGEAE